MSTTHRARLVSSQRRVKVADYQVWAQCRAIAASIVAILAVIALIVFL